MAGRPEPRTEQELLGELVEQLDTAAPYELVEVCQAWLARRLGAPVERCWLDCEDGDEHG